MDLASTLLVGTIGSVLGAVIVFFGQSGWQSLIDTRKASKDRFLSEVKEYNSTPEAVKSRYMFSVVWHLLLANLLWVLPSMIDGVLTTTEAAGVNVGNDDIFLLFWIFSTLSSIGSVAIFYSGIGRIARLRKIQRA